MNLIVTCPRHFEADAREEIRGILNELGDETPAIFLTGMVGILTVESKLDPIKILTKIREKIKEEPWTLRYLRRLIPVEKSVSSDVETIVDESIILASKIEKEKTYRITIEKRNSNISSMDLISKIAGGISNKVNLENPHFVLLIEIIGNHTGISLLKSKDILSIEKEKRKLSE